MIQQWYLFGETTLYGLKKRSLKTDGLSSKVQVKLALNHNILSVLKSFIFVRRGRIHAFNPYYSFFSAFQITLTLSTIQIGYFTLISLSTLALTGYNLIRNGK